MGRLKEFPLERGVSEEVLSTEPDSQPSKTMTGTLREEVESTGLFANIGTES